MSGPFISRSKLANAAGSTLRIGLAVAAIVVVAVLGALAYGWRTFQRSGRPGPIANVIVLRQATMQLLADGFVGCPSVEQVFQLSRGPSRSELQSENTADPWGTPIQIQCDQGRVRVFSMGPDKLPGTADDIGSNQ